MAATRDPACLAVRLATLADRARRHRHKSLADRLLLLAWLAMDDLVGPGDVPHFLRGQPSS